jgi:hypothetical protein
MFVIGLRLFGVLFYVNVFPTSFSIIVLSTTVLLPPTAVQCYGAVSLHIN